MRVVPTYPLLHAISQLRAQNDVFFLWVNWSVIGWYGWRYSYRRMSLARFLHADMCAILSRWSDFICFSSCSCSVKHKRKMLLLFFEFSQSRKKRILFIDFRLIFCSGLLVFLRLLSGKKTYSMWKIEGRGWFRLLRPWFNTDAWVHFARFPRCCVLAPIKTNKKG